MMYPNFIKSCYSGQESFRLYFAGGISNYLQPWFDANNVLKLFTQVTDRKAISNWLSSRRRDNIFLDSGAWAAHSRGVEIDVDEYISYANSISNRCNAIAQVDKIPGVYKQPKTREQVLLAPQQSWNNYLYMREHIEEVNKLLPIFHQGEDFKWLNNMLEYKDAKGNHIEYIGISPANDSHINGKIDFMDKVFKIIGSSSNPNVKTHAFGMTSLYLLERYPFWSADSAGWVKKAAYGFVYIPKPNIVPGEMSYTLIGFGTRTNSPDHFVNQDAITKKYIREYIEQIGVKFDDLSNKVYERSLANCIYLKKWADNYKFTGQSYNKRSLF